MSHELLIQLTDASHKFVVRSCAATFSWMSSLGMWMTDPNAMSVVASWVVTIGALLGIVMSVLSIFSWFEVRKIKTLAKRQAKHLQDAENAASRQINGHGLNAVIAVLCVSLIPLSACTVVSTGQGRGVMTMANARTFALTQGDTMLLVEDMDHAGTFRAAGRAVGEGFIGAGIGKFLGQGVESIANTASNNSVAETGIVADRDTALAATAADKDVALAELAAAEAEAASAAANEALKITTEAAP